MVSIMDSHGNDERSVRKNIRVSIHPHELILSEDQEMKNDEEILCRWCLDQVKDAATYNCKDCSFFLHESCAIDILKRCPNHNWTSIKENEYYGSRRHHKCYRCGEIVSAAAESPPSYVCRTCKVFLHKSCDSNLSSEVKHTSHRKHPLLLIPTCKWKATDSAFVYYCNCCTFALNMKTALQERPLCLREPENHEHQFTPLMRSEYSSLCDACGLNIEQFGSSGPFLCTICQIVVHDECTSLPQTINLFHHNHPLTLTFFFLLKEEDMPHVDQFNCRICHTKVNKDAGGYYCAGCRFATHVGCAYQNLISRNNPTLHAQDAIIVDPFKEIQLTEDESIPAEIKHFSHEHKLSRGDDDEIEDKCCDACIRPISHPFYRCVECKFFLHKSCIELPNQITHIFHDHPLTLLPSAPDDNGTFRCSQCYNNCHGFVYSCEECKYFYVDVRCASIPPNFRHPGHGHMLSFTHTNSFSTRCASCRPGGGKDLFQCTECPFGIDYRCATLPSTARYWDHEHPLVLTYRTVDDGSDAYYCDICEKERNPKHWYYYCAQCDYAAHPDCALGRYPYLLTGRLYSITRPFFIIQGSDFEHRIDLCSECHSLPLFPKTFTGQKIHEHPLVLDFSYLRKGICKICHDVFIGGAFRCEKCHFYAHPRCVLGSPITNIPPRQMSLSIVRRTSWGCIPCMVCDKDCRDVCLKCPKVECTFCVHFDCARSLYRL